MALLAFSRVSVTPMVGAVWVRGVFGLLWALVMIFVMWPRQCWVVVPGGG